MDSCPASHMQYPGMMGSITADALACTHLSVSCIILPHPRMDVKNGRMPHCRRSRTVCQSCSCLWGSCSFRGCNGLPI